MTDGGDVEGTAAKRSKAQSKLKREKHGLASRPDHFALLRADSTQARDPAEKGVGP